MTGGRPRVALVASSYDPYVGGVESHVRHVARALRRRGTDVEVWTVDRGEHLGERVLDDVLVRHLPTPMPARKVPSLAGFATAAPGAWRQWRAAHREFAPDVLHVQCFGPNGAWALALSRRTGTPMVVSSHGETLADDHDAFGGSALLRRALTRAVADAAVTTGCSESVLADLRTRFGLTGGVVVPNGVDLAAYPLGPAGPPRSEDRDPPVVLGIGRLEYNKGFDLLLDAMARVHTERRAGAARLVLVGSGSQAELLHERATSLGIGDRLELTGALDEAGVDAWLRRASVVVVPSRVEAFGIVALEAWRAGAPLVATSLGGPATFVTDDADGLLVDPTDQRALAHAIGALLDDPSRAHRLASAGLERVREYDWSDVAAAYATIHADVLREPSRATT
ncbi:glycosyltransferase family 4 protein [Intrasporangium sp. YIM S08009]|uniref:glycosyltransferase family 4 protein n=1 Tax=Intrasporangium zincisolvens TaxID=3080018 RepID=UPI002B05B0FD|nr:glycosyltransferase family 4 protein [Intrasporangium sp. YIM S08009]